MPGDDGPKDVYYIDTDDDGDDDDEGDEDDDVYLVVPVDPPADAAPVEPQTETAVVEAPSDDVTESTAPAPAAPIDTSVESAEVSETSVIPSGSKALPQTGADWFGAIGLAAAGFVLSLGSLLASGKHEKQ